MQIFKNDRIKEHEILLETEITLQSGEKVKRQIKDKYLDCDRDLKYFVLDKTVRNELACVFATENINKVLDTVILDDIIGYDSVTLEVSNNLDYNIEHGYIIQYIWQVDSKMVKTPNLGWKTIEQYRYTLLKPFTCNYSEVLIKPLLNMEFKNEVANELNIYCGYDGISIYMPSKEVYYTLKNGEKQYMSITLNLKDLMFKVDDVIKKLVRYNMEHLYPADYNMYNEEIEQTIKKEIVNFYNKLHKNILTNK